MFSQNQSSTRSKNQSSRTIGLRARKREMQNIENSRWNKCAEMYSRLEFRARVYDFFGRKGVEDRKREREREMYRMRQQAPNRIRTTFLRVRVRKAEKLRQMNPLSRADKKNWVSKTPGKSKLMTEWDSNDWTELSLSTDGLKTENNVVLPVLWTWMSKIILKRQD